MYNVSGNPSGESSLLPTEQKISVRMSQTFPDRLPCHRNYDNYIVAPARLTKIGDKEILLGAITYAEQETLNFTSMLLKTPLKDGNKEELPFPLQPM